MPHQYIIPPDLANPTIYDQLVHLFTHPLTFAFEDFVNLLEELFRLASFALSPTEEVHFVDDVQRTRDAQTRLQLVQAQNGFIRT